MIEQEESTMFSDRRAHVRYTKKIPLEYEEYNVYLSDDIGQVNFIGSSTINISTGGLLFNSIKPYKLGTLLKIKISIPSYWDRKSKLVKYGHVLKPKSMSILGRVTRVDSLSVKRKFRVAIQTLNIDAVDEKVLNEFLQGRK